MRVYLSGMPELRLGLNDKVLFESTGRGKSKSVELEDVKFHQCVRLSRYYFVYLDIGLCSIHYTGTTSCFSGSKDKVYFLKIVGCNRCVITLVLFNRNRLWRILNNLIGHVLLCQVVEK